MSADPRPIDADKLLRFPIPTVRQTLTPRDAAFYALSVGMARDPLDADQRHFVDPLHGPKVLPAIALVLAHPGFWLADPASGVDPVAVLHAAQSFDITATIPREGLVESRTCVTGLIDKGPGKPALILTETVLHDATGAEFARLRRTTFIRGGGGFGGGFGEDSQPAVSTAPAVERAPDHVIDLPTGREQALLYRLNGDLNPLHSDPVVAQKAGFPTPILHGLCTMGIITHALVRAVGGYRDDVLSGVALRFSQPVFPGETIRTEIWADGRFQARALERDALVATNGRFVVRGSTTGDLQS
jgi:acyl dehydratase